MLAVYMLNQIGLALLQICIITNTAIQMNSCVGGIALSITIHAWMHFIMLIQSSMCATMVGGLTYRSASKLIVLATRVTWFG